MVAIDQSAAFRKALREQLPQATRNQAWVCVHPHSPEPSRGDTVIGATVNQTGALTMGAARVGRDTVLGQIVREVQQATGLAGADAVVRDRHGVAYQR